MQSDVAIRCEEKENWSDKSNTGILELKENMIKWDKVGQVTLIKI